jgi:hypothetical protein
MFLDALCKGWRLSRESNPRPPALQANTLCKELFKTTYYLVFRISASVATAPPSRGEVSWLNVLGRWLRTREDQNVCCCMRIASRRGHHYVELSTSFVQSILIGNRTRTSCTAGKHSMQRAIQTAY